MKTDEKSDRKLLIVDLAQVILICIGVAGLHFFGKPPIEEVINEMVIGEEVSDYWREFLGGIGVLLSLIVLGLLTYFILSWLLAEPIFVGNMKIRHLDLSEEIQGGQGKRRSRGANEGS